GAASPSGRTLPEIRRGGLEALAASVASDPDRRPDLGPTRLHPTAGAIAIGARPFLIAFNVNLAGATLGAARSIARGIRESSGGLPGIRALGLSLESRGLVQVSINVCDHRRTSLARVFREIRERAKAAGARVVESEIVGFVPREALVLSAIEGLALGPAAASKILEDAIGPRDEGLAAYLDALGSASPAPGGGSAAAVVAALAAALARMVAAVGERRAKRGGSEPGGIAALADLLQRADRLRDRLLDLKRRDEAAYAAHVQARKAGDDAAAAALRRAAEVPVDIMEAAADAGGLAREAGALVGGAIAADADAASALAAAACEVASFGLRANLEGLPGDAFRAELTDRARAALRACAAHRPPPGV
ncbi:MAG: cyclodeaminase/cyclohydrolase family protein, partial [Planctomycetes bacterium]|nr:cyclodeaminase/cyclohydrolase family protein [Planctomycetota bacterium]